MNVVSSTDRHRRRQASIGPEDRGRHQRARRRLPGLRRRGQAGGPPQVKEGTAALGFPAVQALVMGVVLSVCVVVYAIPRTAVLGALGITAYLGGAVTANMRVEAPVFSATLFAVYLGVLMWVGMVLRRPELLKVVGLTADDFGVTSSRAMSSGSRNSRMCA